MSDIFTLKSVPFTSELGMALKNFRIERKITAKSITEKFNRASSYVTKLEKGDIKKIDGDFLIQLCDYISGSKNGLWAFLGRLSQNYTDFSNETKFIIMNIDDLLVDYTIPINFASDIKGYLNLHNLTIDQLIDKVNSNEEIINRDEFDSFPDNIWYDKDNDIDNAAIKLVIPSNYIKDLLDGKYVSFHRVIAEAILYSMFKLGNEENPSDILHDKLKLYHLLPSRFVVRITPDTVESILGGLEPDAASALKYVTDDLKMITKLTKNYGTKRIKQIANNMKEDLSFCFAYMSADIVELEKKDKTKKQQFLDELKSLIDKYSQDDTSIDIYE